MPSHAPATAATSRATTSTVTSTATPPPEVPLQAVAPSTDSHTWTGTANRASPTTGRAPITPVATGSASATSTSVPRQRVAAKQAHETAEPQQHRQRQQHERDARQQERDDGERLHPRHPGSDVTVEQLAGRPGRHTVATVLDRCRGDVGGVTEPVEHGPDLLVVGVGGDRRVHVLAQVEEELGALVRGQRSGQLLDACQPRGGEVVVVGGHHRRSCVERTVSVAARNCAHTVRKVASRRRPRSVSS